MYVGVPGDPPTGAAPPPPNGPSPGPKRLGGVLVSGLSLNAPRALNLMGDLVANPVGNLMGRAVSKNQDFPDFIPKDSLQGQAPGTTNRQPPPTAANRQPLGAEKVP